MGSKVNPVLNKAPCHKGICGYGGIAPRILTLGIRWRWIVERSASHRGYFTPGERAPGTHGIWGCFTSIVCDESALCSVFEKSLYIYTYLIMWIGMCTLSAMYNVGMYIPMLTSLPHLQVSQCITTEVYTQFHMVSRGTMTFGTLCSRHYWIYSHQASWLKH
jgi:hypothetical protein